MLARILFTLTFLAGSAMPASAQGPAETGSDGGPRSTVTAPHTSAVGRTKPPGAAAAPDTPEARERRSRVQKENDAIETGICIGCNK